MKTTALAAAAVALALTGCSSGSEPAPASNDQVIEQAEDDAASTDQVIAHMTTTLKARPDPLGISPQYDAAGASDPCTISVLMTTPEEIALYEDAGDDVIKNPSGTVGVKLTTTDADRAACMRAMSDALEGV